MNTISISKKHLLVLFISAFSMRAIIMFFFIQSNTYYKQPDSTDYHHCAITVAVGRGMQRLDTHEPIFWRTPGYPWYLAFFYKLCGISSIEFGKNSSAQCMALWLQILLASSIPLILFFLAYTLTHIASIAYLVAWISVVHPGLVIASCCLLTEGLALIFFFLFMLFYYLAIANTGTNRANKKWNSFYLIIAVASLSAYTWMRPMGEFVGYLCALFLFFAYPGSLKQKLMRSLLFGALFFASLFPWYYRNYTLTGEWFFCPTIGTYLNVFNAPKILRRTTGKSLPECHKIMGQRAALETYKRQNELRGTGKFVSHTICKKVSVPVCMSQPWYFIYDWIMECLKTTFDLYSYQLVTMANQTWWYDPIEEYLPDKIAACLYKEHVPLPTRIICWMELLCALVIWIGFFASVWQYAIMPLFRKRSSSHSTKIWLVSVALIGLCIGMTGGFGYARLRLPVEPLILILSLTFWYMIFKPHHLKDTRTHD